jgi:hypothetical protein
MTRFVKLNAFLVTSNLRFEFIDGKKTGFISYHFGGDFHRVVAFLCAATGDVASGRREHGFNGALSFSVSRRYAR